MGLGSEIRSLWLSACQNLKPVASALENVPLRDITLIYGGRLRENNSRGTKEEYLSTTYYLARDSSAKTWNLVRETYSFGVYEGKANVSPRLWPGIWISDLGF